MSPRSIMAASACLFLVLSGPVRAAPPVSETSIVAAPHPYDEESDARTEIAAAREQAKTSGKKVMIVFGANWCPDCRALAGVLTFKDVHDWTATQYVVVEVDVGRFNKNLDVAQGFGLDLKHNGIPTVAVLAPGGELLNAGDAMVLSDARTMTPQSIVDVLARWAQATSS
ncbi:MAG TPA: thioredoxin family protein [Aliidongia sp.]|nr:thioredoxin family protein [Aliidongia sp.]